MKTSTNWVIGILLTLSILPVSAQKNIQSAIREIIECPEAKIKETSTLQKDYATNIKTGESNVYTYRLPSNKMNLIKAAITAFEKDKDKSYSYMIGNAQRNSQPLKVAVGDGTGASATVQINTDGYNYLYGLFLAPKTENPEGHYRYAYIITYKEEKGEIVGKIVKTYATTLTYRQQLQQDIIRDAQQNSNYKNNSQSNSKTWFNEVMSCFQNLSEAGPQARIKLVTKAYNLINDISKYPEVTLADKNTVREILQGLIQDKEYSETVLNKLLNQCYNNLK